MRYLSFSASNHGRPRSSVHSEISRPSVARLVYSRLANQTRALVLNGNGMRICATPMPVLVDGDFHCWCVNRALECGVIRSQLRGMAPLTLTLSIASTGRRPEKSMRAWCSMRRRCSTCVVCWHPPASDASATVKHVTIFQTPMTPPNGEVEVGPWLEEPDFRDPLHVRAHRCLRHSFPKTLRRA